MLWLVKGLGPGGAERLLLAHAAVADRSSFSYRVAYLVPWKSHLVEPMAALGVPAVCLSNRPWWVVRVWRAMRNADVVHVHSPLIAAVARVLVRLMRRRPAIVTTEHNVWPRHARPTRLANRLTVGLEDHMLAVSAAVRDSMPARVRDRVEVLTHGIDLEGVRAEAGDRAAARAALGVDDETVVCVTVANLRNEKGYDTLLDAAARCDGAPVRFFAAGQGPLEAELHERARALGLGDWFTFLGYRESVAPVLAAADLFVLSSRHEGLPLAVMEALALGLPVVATAVGGVPEAVRDGIEGALVAPDDPAALADAVLRLAGDPARRAELSQAAAARAVEFGAERAVGRIEAVYREVARR